MPKPKLLIESWLPIEPSEQKASGNEDQWQHYFQHINSTFGGRVAPLSPAGQRLNQRKKP